MPRATNSCRLHRTVINQLNRRHLFLMRNRHEILLRDHSVLEVYLKTCLQHYTVWAVTETRTIAQGPNRPHNTTPVPQNKGGAVSFQFQFWHGHTGSEWFHKDSLSVADLDFLKWGRQHRKTQTYYLNIFPENCMKMKKCWPGERVLSTLWSAMAIEW